MILVHGDVGVVFGWYLMGPVLVLWFLVILVFVIGVRVCGKLSMSGRSWFN